MAQNLTFQNATVTQINLSVVVQQIYTPTDILLIAGVAILCLIGFWLIWKIVKKEWNA